MEEASGFLIHGSIDRGIPPAVLLVGGDGNVEGVSIWEAVALVDESPGKLNHKRLNVIIMWSKALCSRWCQVGQQSIQSITVYTLLILYQKHTDAMNHN
ncbi:hypothetical protein EYF80_045245 [Liparis tanakae]|uniref:Uncharacterized protein n=1 Tax=Liparis tanakae TaxID=230148 RepID=A0A4Z2FU77_9TELE|nr:hypothetical protein EYF80_045245 [Liparis tanakae]